MKAFFISVRNAFFTLFGGFIMAKELNSSVVRVHKNTDFTSMSNHHLRNQKLTLKAVGLMSKILGLPDGWNYSVAGLVKICREGETAPCMN